ncbi:MAG TPA: oxaloacetate decarboxylase subunit alpha, partial [Synergistaceae bacterium]|nr:oxaloacetate decarboxylase subunit alpha [Synergistaceae bacterium]
AREAIKPYILQPEDVLSYAIFPQVAKDFLPRKFARETGADGGFETPVEDGVYPV